MNFLKWFVIFLWHMFQFMGMLFGACTAALYIFTIGVNEFDWFRIFIVFWILLGMSRAITHYLLWMAKQGRKYDGGNRRMA